MKVIVLGYAVLKSDLSVGAIVTVLSLLGKAYEPIAIFNVEYVDYKLNKVAVKKYIDILDIKDDEYLTKGTKIKNLNDKIELKNVSYTYNKHTKNIIENLSLNINENTSVALVGESGSGKSTIIKLIMGLIKYKKRKYINRSKRIIKFKFKFIL